MIKGCYSNSEPLPLRGCSTWDTRQEFSGGNCRCECFALDLRNFVNFVNLALNLRHSWSWHSGGLHFCAELREFLVGHLLASWVLLLFCNFLSEFFATFLHRCHWFLCRLLNFLAFRTLYLSLRLERWFGTYPLCMEAPSWPINCGLHCRLFPRSWRCSLGCISQQLGNALSSWWCSSYWLPCRPWYLSYRFWSSREYLLCSSCNLSLLFA